MAEAALPRRWLTDSWCGWTLLSFWVQISELRILARLQQSQILLLPRLQFHTIIVYFTNTVTMIVMFHIFPSRGGWGETPSMNGSKILNVLHHLKIIIDSHIAFIRVFEIDLKPVFAGGGESVDIFQANHSFTWRYCVKECHHDLPFDSKPASNSAKVL